MKFILCLALLLSLTGTALAAQTAGPVGTAPAAFVTNDWDEARGEALARGTAILAYSNGSCRHCLEPVQELLRHPSFARSAPGIIVWMRPARASDQVPRLPRRTDPLVHVVDAWGAQRAQFAMVEGTVTLRRFDPSPLVNYAVSTVVSGPAFHAAGLLLGKDPDSPAGAFNLGTGHLLLGAFDEARSSFEHAHRRGLARGDVRTAEAAMVELELVRAVRGDRDGAIGRLAVLAPTITTPDVRGHALAVRANLLLADGRRDEARRAFETALASVPPGSAIHASIEDARNRQLTASQSQLPLIELRLPPQRPLRGVVRIEAIPSSPVVAAVDFIMEGKAPLRAGEPPFIAAIDLGGGQPTSITAIPRGADGSELGRITYPVNRNWDDFSIGIASPTGNALSGEIIVDVRVSPPAGEEISQVAVYWNEELQDTVTIAPWRLKGTVPPSDPGFLRVVARSSSGREAEDTKPVNLTGGVDSFEVTRTELPVRVRNRGGDVIPDLEADDFILEVAGQQRSLDSVEFQDQGSLTVGLVIDASTSMRAHMMDVHLAARELLRETLESPGGRCFVVEFADSARLVHPLSRNLESLSASVDTIQAAGRTALWDAVVLSLLQMRGIKGRKAIVVLTDGLSTPARYREADAVRVARESATPIFTVSLYDPALAQVQPGMPRRGPRQSASDIIRAAMSTGGDSHFVRSTDELDDTFLGILASVRQQYVLVFSPDTRGNRRWSSVDVEVKRRGMRIHAPDGVWEGGESAPR